MGAIIYVLGLMMGICLMAVAPIILKVARQFHLARHELYLPDIDSIITALIIGCFLYAPLALPAGVYALYIRKKLALHLDSAEQSP